MYKNSSRPEKHLHSLLDRSEQLIILSPVVVLCDIHHGMVVGTLFCLLNSVVVGCHVLRPPGLLLEVDVDHHVFEVGECISQIFEPNDQLLRDCKF